MINLTDIFKRYQCNKLGVNMKYLISIVIFCFTIITFGFAVEQKNESLLTKTIQFNVAGMTCQNCVNRCGQSIDGLDGILNYHVDLDSGKVTIDYDPVKINPIQIREALVTTPFKISNSIEESAENSNSKSLINKFFNLIKSKKETN